MEGGGVFPLLLLLLSHPAASSSLPLCALMVVLYVPRAIFLLSFYRFCLLPASSGYRNRVGGQRGRVNGHMTQAAASRPSVLSAVLRNFRKNEKGPTHSSEGLQLLLPRYRTNKSAISPVPESV